MRSADEIDDNELEWRTAEAVVEPHKWMACTLIARVLAADEEGISVAAWCRESADIALGGDAYEPFALLSAVQDAADMTGLALPWTQRVHDGDLVLTLTDRDAAARLLEATLLLPQLDVFIRMVTAE